MATKLCGPSCVGTSNFMCSFGHLIGTEVFHLVNDCESQTLSFMVSELELSCKTYRRFE